ncbi:MAG TPA: glycosyltransferase family 39 protein [Ktedonobacterales bacterium]
MLGVVLGHAYCDPQFYNYAGQLAAGHLPYRDYLVEYPPLALVLILLPALALLPFPRIAPRPDTAFGSPTHPLTHMPQPDPLRYGAYATSFAIELLLIDALTLLLVLRVARWFVPGNERRSGASAGWIYLLATLACGALLQKFDLAAGLFVLLAVALLVARSPRLAWAALAAATLIKGYPALLAPLFITYTLASASDPSASLPREGHVPGVYLRGALRTLRARWVVVRSQMQHGLLSFALVMTLGLAPALAAGGPGALLHPLLLQSDRSTEIESLYANLMLLLSGLPGLAVRTTFSASDLSRVVVSPLQGLVQPVSTVLLVVLVSLAYFSVGRALRPAIALSRRKGTAEPLQTSFESRDRAQMLAAGALLLLLAFVLAFRALPLHYLLLLLPLVALTRLPRPRATVTLWSAIAVVAILGQLLTIPALWHTLVNVDPVAIILLTLRNLAWIAAFGILVGSLWSWQKVSALREGRHMGVTSAPPRQPAVQSPRQMERAGVKGAGSRWSRLVERWRRLRRSAPPVPGFSPRVEDVFAHLLSRIPPSSLILAAGLVTAIIYVGFVAAFPITVWWSHPQLAIEMGQLTGYSPLAAAAFVFSILALFACQFLALFAAGRLPQILVPSERREQWARRLVFFLPALFVLILIWMQPITTTDLYGYVARGYLYVHLHLNPMIDGAKLLPGGLSVDRPAAPYGPLWLLIAAGVSRLAGENLLANMLLFKLIAALATIAAFALVDRLVRQLFPERRLRAYVLFAWSPLLLFEAIGNGHNDIVMMLCVLLAFALMLRGRGRTAFAFLILGGLIKYVSLVIIPFWLIYELRHRAAIEWPVAARRRASKGWTSWAARQVRALRRVWQTMNRREAGMLLASAACTSAALFAVCYAPFWAGMRTFTGLGQQLRPLYYNGSIVQFVAAPIELMVPLSQYPALDKTVRLVFYIAFGVYTLVQSRRLWLLGAQADLRDVITASAKVIFAALILITFWFQPWYVVWLLPLVALSRQSFVRRQTALLAAGALLTYAISNYFPVGTSGIGRDLFVQFFEILVTFCPLLLLRPTSVEESWGGIARRYVHQISETLRVHPIWWERAMLGLILVVAALLRLLRLGNPFAIVSSGSSGALQELGGDLKLYLVDPRGLHGPFVALQGIMVDIFGRTPLAALLPSAIIGTLTVFVVYLLAFEVTRQGKADGRRGVALVAALFAATSTWHVSLSRSGMEVVLVPLLVCTALYWLLLALRLNATREDSEESPDASRSSPHAGGAASRSSQRVDNPSRPRNPSRPKPASVEARCLALLAGCGVATGLACDIAPGLWLLPLLVGGVLIVWRWRVPKSFTHLGKGLVALFGAALLCGLPAVWTVVSPQIGFAPGSTLFARSSQPMAHLPAIVSRAFWGQVASNAGGALHILVAQDYSAGYPANGGTAILPAGLGWLFFLGVALVLLRWRDMTSLALVLLLALPLVASVAVGAPAAVIEAAAVLPATCIVPALALHAVANVFGHLPIVIDRVNGARVFNSPEQIARILLFVFLLITTIRTFFWYFEATLPSTPPNQWIPT